MMGRNKFVNLSRQCNPPTTYGKATKEALAEGKLPPHITHWPDEVDKMAKPIFSSTPSSSRAHMRPVAGTRVVGLPYPGEPIAPSNLASTRLVRDENNRDRDVIAPNPYALTPPNDPLVDLVELHSSGEPVL